MAWKLPNRGVLILASQKTVGYRAYNLPDFKLLFEFHRPDHPVLCPGTNALSAIVYYQKTYPKGNAIYIDTPILLTEEAQGSFAEKMQTRASDLRRGLDGVTPQYIDRIRLSYDNPPESHFAQYKGSQTKMVWFAAKNPSIDDPNARCDLYITKGNGILRGVEPYEDKVVFLQAEDESKVELVSDDQFNMVNKLWQMLQSA